MDVSSLDLCILIIGIYWFLFSGAHNLLLFLASHYYTIGQGAPLFSLPPWGDVLSFAPIPDQAELCWPQQTTCPFSLFLAALRHLNYSLPLSTLGEARYKLVPWATHKQFGAGY